MRTTLVLKDELRVEAKKRAAERKSNVSVIVNEALRAAFRSPPPKAVESPLFLMPTFRPATGGSINTSPEEFAELLVAQERKPYES
jgi:hypothetical protein